MFGFDSGVWVWFLWGRCFGGVVLGFGMVVAWLDSLGVVVSLFWVLGVALEAGLWMLILVS